MSMTSTGPRWSTRWSCDARDAWRAPGRGAGSRSGGAARLAGVGHASAAAAAAEGGAAAGGGAVARGVWAAAWRAAVWRRREGGGERLPRWARPRGDSALVASAARGRRTPTQRLFAAPLAPCACAPPLWATCCPCQGAHLAGPTREHPLLATPVGAPTGVLERSSMAPVLVPPIHTWLAPPGSTPWQQLQAPGPASTRMWQRRGNARTAPRSCHAASRLAK